MMTDSDYMRRAMVLALKAKGQTSPNPMVGAVVVKDNRIIAEGFHRRCGSAHAEAVALKKAGVSAQGASLYVTLEPCSHFGRTPPCVDQIVRSGIKKVFVGMKDPNPINNGRSLLKLKRAGIETKTGILEDELKRMNEAFIKYITTKRPFVVAKSAQTLDGRIATRSGQSRWITSRKSRDFGRRLRNDVDAILVGSRTVLKDNPSLRAPKKSKCLKKIIVDTRLQISLKAKLLRGTRPEDIIIATTQKAPRSKREAFRRKNISVMIAPLRNGKVNLKWLLRQLAKREIAHVLIEGGGAVIGSALRDNLIDKMVIFISPKIMGDDRAVGSLSGLNPRNVNRLRQLHRLTVTKIGQDILLEGYVSSKRKKNV